MKKVILVIGILLSCLSFGRVMADGNQKPNHYGDWDVLYDKVLKKTTLIHQNRPTADHVPGMGDAFSADTFQLEYSLEAIFTGTPGTPTFKVAYYWLFDNPLNLNATYVLANPVRFFKYSPNTQFTLLIDDATTTTPVQNYHTAQYGDSIIGVRPYEEMQVPLTQADLAKMLTAKEVAGNLSADDQNANKSFTFDQNFKDVLNAFAYRVNEISSGVPVQIKQ